MAQDVDGAAHSSDHSEEALTASLSEGTELLSDLGLDSMKVMQLLLETEERFDISIPLNIIPNVRTAGDFARQIEQLTEQR